MARKISVEIVGDSSSLERAFRRSSAGAEQFNRNIEKTGKHESVFHGLGKAIGGATALLGVGGLAEAAKTAFNEMEQGQKVAAQTTAVLKSTGDAANVTAGHVDQLSNSLLAKSGVDDEVIKSGENMLLTFTNIRNEAGKGNDIFDQATKTLLDMSVATGQDMTKSAIQLGKALNDPIKGMGALQRVGVTFTDAQKKQIKAMVDSGNTMGAQKVILHELSKEFGGSAEAAGKTFPGKLNILKETLKNLGGQIATQLLPSLTGIIKSFTDWISKTQNQKMVMDIFKGAVSAVKTAVGLLSGAFKFLSGVVGGNKQAIEFLIGVYAGWKIGKLILSIGQLATSFVSLGAVEATTAAETEGLAIMLGPVGLVAGALAAGAALGTLLMQIGPVRDAINGLTNDIAGLLGYQDPMKQFANTQVTQSNIAAARTAAGKLEYQGFTPSQAAARLASQFPTLAPRDLQIAAGVYGQRPTVAINGGVTIQGVQNPKDFYDQLAAHAKTQQIIRRG